MLRPTPPTVEDDVPGLLVPRTGDRRCAPVSRTAADDEHRVGLGAQQVRAADDPLLHEVGQVHRDRGPGGADALGQGCGVEHGVGTQQGDDLVFASSQFHIGTLKEPWVYKQGVALLEVAGHRVSATCRVR
jgi:hypothetical protein